ncbi:hypothetical protein SAMN05660816_05123 [Niastella yeongjuensis]|nr:hypothetical protein SAMN05660816_05123 [Niastella yeongjuensis]
MKKVKLMLMSLALIAVVGAALAFKAKYSQRYCTTLAQPNIPCRDLLCPNGPFTPSTLGTGPNAICTAIVPAGGCFGVKCADAPSVPALRQN